MGDTVSTFFACLCFCAAPSECGFLFLLTGGEATNGPIFRPTDPNQRRHQRLRLGQTGAGAAAGHRHPDDRADQVFPGKPPGLLGQAHHRQPVQKARDRAQQGQSGNLAVPGAVYRAGGNGGYRQHRRCSGRDRHRRRRRGANASIFSPAAIPVRCFGCGWRRFSG